MKGSENIWTEGSGEVQGSSKVLPRIVRRQRWWKALSFLWCLRSSVQNSEPYSSTCSQSWRTHFQEQIVLWYCRAVPNTRYRYCQYQVLEWWYRVLESVSFDAGYCHIWPLGLEVSLHSCNICRISTLVPELENSFPWEDLYKAASINMLLFLSKIW